MTSDTPSLLAQLTAAGPERLAAIEELTRRREFAAAKPLIKLLREDLSEAELAAIFAALPIVGSRGLMPMLQHAARSQPALADRIMAVHAVLRRPDDVKPGPGLRWVDVAGGRLSVGPRPKIKALAEMREAGVTHLVTLLCEGEGARDLGAAARAAGLAWLWLPLRNGDPPATSEHATITAALDTWALLLASGAALYIHCAAGIHRTGMLTHALLRRTGHSPEAARDLLARLRQLTAAEAGAHRLEWGHHFAP